MVAVNMSQRIVGQSVWLELVSIDPTTAQPDGRNAAAWRLDGASATLANYEVQSEGAPRLGSTSGSTVPTTAPAGWSVLELEPTNDECYFHGRALDGTGPRANSYARQQQLPDPAALYRFRIRVRNRQVFRGISAVANNGSSAVRITRAAHGYVSADSVTVANVAGVPGANGTFAITVIDANNFDLIGSSFTGAYVNTGWATISRNLAPATSTDLRLQFVSLSDYVELTTAITAGRANAVAGQGVGVNVLSAAAPALSVVGGQARNTAGAVPVLAATGYAANPVAVTAARGVDLLATLIGALVTKPYALPEADWQFAGVAGGNINATDVVLRAAGAAGIIGCFGEPGLEAAREILPIPVLGMADASIRAALRLAPRVAVLKGGAAWVPMLEEFFAVRGLTRQQVRVAATTPPGDMTARDPPGAARLLAETALAEITAGAGARLPHLALCGWVRLTRRRRAAQTRPQTTKSASSIGIRTQEIPNAIPLDAGSRAAGWRA
jgi:hypothetical protein